MPSLHEAGLLRQNFAVDRGIGILSQLNQTREADVCEELSWPPDPEAEVSTPKRLCITFSLVIVEKIPINQNYDLSVK